MRFFLPILAFLGAGLAGCTTTGGNPIADMMLPSDAPPRRGTAAYDSWQAERAAEAARPKSAAAAK
jgi:hypothetical protein